MKKFVSILALTAIFCVNALSATWDYWNGGLYSGGPKVCDMMAEMPYVSQEYATIEKAYITNGKLDLSVSMKLSWHNFYKLFGLNSIWANWILQGFNYERKVYYSAASSTSFTELTELAESGYIDVTAVSYRSEKPTSKNSYWSRENNYLFEQNMSCDVSNLYQGKLYQIKIEYTFKPTAYSEHDKTYYSDAETERYLRENTYVIEGNVAGAKLQFILDKPVSNSTINVNGVFNPLYDTGSGARYLVYDNPNAIISVVTDTANLPVSKTSVSGTVITTKYGIGGYLASIGTNSIPTECEYPQMSGCGAYDTPQCSRNCSDPQSKYMEYLNDNKLQKTFLSGKGYDVSTYCYRRYTNLMQRSIDAAMTQYDENAVEQFSKTRNFGYRMSRSFHLRDFNNVNVYTKVSYGAGSILRIQNTSIYVKNPDAGYLENLLALGYAKYGPNENSDLSFGKGTLSNILDFEIVSPVSFPRLTEEQMASQMTCVTDSLVREGDFIHLKGMQVECGLYSPSMYNPGYTWEVSFDGEKWEDISNFERYIVDRCNIKFAVVMDADKDVLLKSTILKNKEKALFRQKVILRSFASNEYSDLYNYKHKEEGRYFISVTSPDYYTYVPSPILSSDNMTFNPSSFPQEQRICKGDALKNDKISFKLQKSTNVSESQIAKLAEIADYKIYELFGDSVGKIVARTNNYIINYKGESVAYRCVASWCRDSLYQDVSVIVNEIDMLDVEQVKSDVMISERDKDNGRLSLLCVNGIEPEIIVDEEKSANFTYLVRSVVPFVAPVLPTTDFTAMTRSKIVSYMKKCGWDYEAETGTNVEEAGLQQLRSWCRVKEDRENQNVVDVARNDNAIANSWRNFDDGNVTKLKVPAQGGSTAEFFIMKRNNATLCLSDSVKVTVGYFAGIENNQIHFASTSYSSKSEIFITENSPSPKINGYSISGGYGEPSESNNLVYAYRYLIREIDGPWQPLSELNEVKGGASKELSLQNGAVTIDRSYQICRVAYSRSGDDFLSQVSDTSNVLMISMIEQLSENDIVVEGDGRCAGEVVTLAIKGYDPSKEVKERTTFVWSANDNNLNIVASGEMDKFCNVYGSTGNFTVSVYRYDTISKVKSNVVRIPIEVKTVKPYFTIKTDDVERNILDYVDDVFYFQSGTRFELINKSEDAESYLWNLELQYYTGAEIEGLTSYLENPVCYLYNPGQNKIRLTAKNSFGCEAQITAENIYVQSSSQLKSAVASYFEDSAVERNITESSVGCYFEVYPTIVSQEKAHLLCSSGRFRYVLTDGIGKVIAEAYSDYGTDLDISQLQPGIYFLTLSAVNDEGNGIESQNFKIVKR